MVHVEGLGETRLGGIDCQSCEVGLLNPLVEALNSDDPSLGEVGVIDQNPALATFMSALTPS
jgi:hypothetical protein